jgi:hypothetical protein
MTCRLGSMIETRGTHHVIGLHQAGLKIEGRQTRTTLGTQCEAMIMAALPMAMGVIFREAREG